jgi:hypothetical protein
MCRNGLMFAALAFLPALTIAEPIELTTPDGRRVLLNADRTWEYIDEQVKDSESVKTAPLALLNRKDAPKGCRFGLKLTNELGFKIRSLVPQFSAITHGGIVYQTVFQSFDGLRPTSSQYQEVEFRGIECDAILELRVSGGDRCSMGELDRFSSQKGVCLAHIRLLETDIVPFTK